jgi:2-oxoglutarate ferredoxin oxidoreductase subunit alpha
MLPIRIQQESIIMTDVSIVLAGAAGQGLQTVEQLLTHTLKLSGYHIFATKEYMSRIRGGINSTEIRVSSEPVRSYVERIDLLISLSTGVVHHLEHRLSRETVIISDPELAGETDCAPCKQTIEVSFTDIAKEVGKPVYSTIVAAGAVAGLLDVDLSVVHDYIEERFSRKGNTIVSENKQAASRGFSIGRDLAAEGFFQFELQQNEETKNHVMLSGSEAVGMGALAGGGNFLSFYPMSPGTGVAAFVAHHAERFGVIVEQAEDEIAAINMAIGAGYAGARGFVTTSGGGFALMVEGLSLAGMIETPVVIHIGQRPGPATGLPTRTEQGDLLFALFAGHGEFPRVIFTPGTLEEAFALTQRAFNIADEYQVPAIVLTDQYFLDSYYNVRDLGVEGLQLTHHVVKTTESYRRYEVREGGVSPRGVPGYGQGLVVVDSDEHDEWGHLTEDLQLRTQMNAKRLGKLELMREQVLPPTLLGDEAYDTLIICWGSTRNVMEEVLHALNKQGMAALHFGQVYPLPMGTKGFLDQAQKTIAVENNATGQFAQLVRLETGVAVDRTILHSHGLPFSKEALIERVQQELEAS